MPEMWNPTQGPNAVSQDRQGRFDMNLSDPGDVHYLYEKAFGEWPDGLEKIHESLKRLRYGGAMDKGEDLRTNLICTQNILLDLLSYLRTHECVSMKSAEKK